MGMGITGSRKRSVPSYGRSMWTLEEKLFMEEITMCNAYMPGEGEEGREEDEEVVVAACQLS